MTAPDSSSEPAGDGPCETAENGARGATSDRAHRVAVDLARARKLSRRLRIEVAIDGTPWPRHEVELVFTKNPDGTLRPLGVRVSREASDEEVLADGGLVARCEQYNAALGKLRQLAEQLSEAVRDGRIALVPGSPIAYAHRELARLDQLIERRQEITMSRDVVRLGALRREIEFFERCDAHLAPIVHAAPRVASSAQSGSAPPARRARRWWRW
jgi:hypothetical protein